jgi:hypothetical protein
VRRFDSHGRTRSPVPYYPISCGIFFSAEFQTLGMGPTFVHTTVMTFVCNKVDGSTGALWTVVEVDAEGNRRSLVTFTYEAECQQTVDRLNAPRGRPPRAAVTAAPKQQKKTRWDGKNRGSNWDIL